MDRVKKFGKLSIDQKTGQGTLEVVAKRIMSDDVDLIIEVLKRYTEIQYVKLQKCFLTDDLLVKIHENGLKGLRHLKSLYLASNMLSGKSVELLVKEYSQLARQIINLDLRGNSLTEDDAEALYNAFPNVQTLNEIQMYKYKRDLTNTEIDCHSLQLKLPEMKLIVCLVQQLGRRCHLATLDVSNNLISAKALKVLAEGIRLVPVHEIDISYNPCTDDDLDFTGVEAMYLSIHTAKFITNLYHDGVTIPEEYIDFLECSLKVNRSLLLPAKNGDGVIKDKFFSYIFDIVEERTAPLPENMYKGLEFDYEMDRNFCRLNRVPETLVSMGELNRGFSIIRKQDKRKATKHEF